MIASLISVYKDPQHMCKMEIEDAPQGDIHNERRRRRNLDFRKRQRRRKELAKKLANQMRLDDDAGNLAYANSEIREHIEQLRGRTLYIGYWTYICNAIDNDRDLSLGTEEQRRKIKEKIVEAFQQNEFEYIENGSPGEYASFSTFIDIFSERLVNRNQLLFARRLIQYIDIPSMRIDEDRYNYLRIYQKANEFIHDNIDRLSRIVGLWVHICTAIDLVFREYNGNLTDIGGRQSKIIRRIIAKVFQGADFKFAHPNRDTASDFDETSILYSNNRP